MIRLTNRMRIAPPKATGSPPEAPRGAVRELRQFDLADRARLSKKVQNTSGKPPGREIVYSFSFNLTHCRASPGWIWLRTGVGAQGCEVTGVQRLATGANGNGSISKEPDGSAAGRRSGAA